jgi:glycosyltransferase involved in cell wall biosynthesis
MRILSLTYEYPPIGGGGGVVAAALNAALAAEGHHVDVVTSFMPELAPEEDVDGVHVHRAPCWRRHRHYSTAPELATTLWPAYSLANRLVLRQPPDVIHAHFALPTGIVARALALKHDIPYVLTAHGSDIPGYNPDRFELLHTLLAPLWRKVMRDASAVTSPSRFLSGLIHRHLDVPVQIVPNGYYPGTTLGFPKRKLVLVVARLFPRKGVQHFIDAAAALGGDWELIVAGDGPYRGELQERATRAGAKVRFVGFLGRAELRGLYEQARIFVFPSIRENFPMVLLEAMDAGCAVITTDAEGCAEVVGDAGVVIGKSDSTALRTAMLALMSDEQRCETLSQLAMARALQFRWPRICTQFSDAFAAVAHRAGTRSRSLLLAR